MRTEKDDSKKKKEKKLFKIKSRYLHKLQTYTCYIIIWYIYRRTSSIWRREWTILVCVRAVKHRVPRPMYSHRRHIIVEVVEVGFLSFVLLLLLLKSPCVRVCVRRWLERLYGNWTGPDDYCLLARRSTAAEEVGT